MAKTIEAVARAIATKRIWEDVEPVDDGTPSTRYVWKMVERRMPEAREEARAAILALAANVSPEMLIAAYNELHDDFTAIPNGMLHRAISAALLSATEDAKHG